MDETAVDVASHAHGPGPREVAAQPESELGRASSAERPRKMKKTNENSDVQDEIQLYVSEKAECYEIVKTSESF